MNQSLTRSASLPTIRNYWRRIVFSLSFLVATFAAVTANSATEIVASGVWNVAIFTPACNYTEHETFDITYANGSYSATVAVSNSRGLNCQNDGPQNGAVTDFYRSDQDLLSSSQLKDFLNALVSEGGSNVQSVNLISADSFSGTAIDFDGLAASFQATRATSTSYILAVTNSGSGTVTSSIGGISCGTTCSANFASGTNVTLTATPTDGNFFYGWNGDCSDKDGRVCTVTMDEAKEITARFKPIPFAVAVTGVTVDGLITTPIATVTTTITFNPPDVGKSGGVFVTAWTPYTALNTLGISTAANAMSSVTSTLDDPTAVAATDLRLTIGTLEATDANSFVLIQLTSSGWQLVVNGQLIPYASGVLGDQLAAQTILNNAATTNLVGAQFCLGYGSSAAEMTTAGRMQLIATVPDPNVTNTAGSCLVTSPQAGVWWNPTESGRGYYIEANANGTVLFGSYLYDPTGRATWYSSALTRNGESYTGSLDSYRGGQSLSGAYTAPSVTIGAGGNVTLTLTDPSNGTINWAGGTTSIQRFRFDAAPGSPPAFQPQSGAWWNPAESGRGFALEINGSTVFLGGYMYDPAGNPIWYLSTGTLVGQTYQGNWTEYANGQTLGGNYVPPTVINNAVGQVSITFSSPTAGMMSMPDGRVIPITRFIF